MVEETSQFVVAQASATVMEVPSRVCWFQVVWISGYPQRFPLNFSPYITFLGHIINSVSPTFSSPAVVSPKYPPIPHYNIKYYFLYLLFIYYQFFFYY
jgi:hypothetical protein